MSCRVDIRCCASISHQQAYSTVLSSLISASQTPDSKKEEYRKYLEKSGVIDALTKVLVGLYEEPDRPVNAVDYIKRYMGAPANVDVEALKNDNQELKAEVMDLKKTVEELKATVGETKGEVQRRSCLYYIMSVPFYLCALATAAQ
eukprot:scaffold319786_cov60-Attheya_sp.AAC.2